MLKKSYCIKNQTLYIQCEIVGYEKIINDRMKMFNETDNLNYDVYLKIYNNKTVYKCDDKEETIFGKLIHTDLYPLMFNIIANIINDNKYMILHSVLLCYNNKGFLMVGDFNSGKTSLCLKSLTEGFEILSADQTILIKKDNSILLDKGSLYLHNKDGDDIFLKIDNPNIIEIKYIINLIGLCDGGNYKFELVNDKYHKDKILFKYFTWHADIPLFTNDKILNINRIKIKNWLSKINIPLYNVRGDINQILIKLKEIEHD